MQKADNHYELIILVVSALVAVGISIWLIMDSTSFSEGLKMPPVVENHEYGEIPVENAQNALTTLNAKFVPWKAPVRNNKPVPLDKGILLVFKDDQVFDLYLEDHLLRPPMTNEFLRKYNLDYLSPNVGDQDTDGDGFTNLEEFKAGTDPNDPKSHPPVTDKLFYVERIEHPYLITLKSSSAPYQVVVTPPAKPRKGMFVEDIPGTKFGPDPKEKRFEFVKMEIKKVPDPRLGEKDVSEMTIKDLQWKKNLVLQMNVEQNLAEYDARFEFRLGNNKPIIVPNGQTFRLEGHLETTYKVIDIQPDSAVICPLGPEGNLLSGKEIVIKKG